LLLYLESSEASDAVLSPDSETPPAIGMNVDATISDKWGSEPASEGRTQDLG
jgi:hypothetical protein